MIPETRPKANSIFFKVMVKSQNLFQFLFCKLREKAKRMNVNKRGWGRFPSSFSPPLPSSVEKMTEIECSSIHVKWQWNPVKALCIFPLFSSIDTAKLHRTRWSVFSLYIPKHSLLSYLLPGNARENDFVNGFYRLDSVSPMISFRIYYIHHEIQSIRAPPYFVAHIERSSSWLQILINGYERSNL